METNAFEARLKGFQRPKVSILLAVYNGEKYLSATIDSVLAQSMDDWELFIVDDGSKDASWPLIEKYQDPRIQSCRQNNSGAAAAILRGYQHTSGEYVVFLDQDDLWEPEFLQSQIDKLETTKDLQACFTWFKLIDSHGRELGLHSQRHRGRVTFDSLLRDFVIGATSNVLMRRQAIEQVGGIDVSFRRMYDLDLFLRIARIESDCTESGCIESIPKDLMRYRRHGSQMSSDYHGLMEEWNRVFFKLKSIAPDIVEKNMHIAKSNAARYFSRVAYEQKQFPIAIKLLTKGFVAAPLRFFVDTRNWITLGAALCGCVLPKRIHRSLEKLAGFDRE